jgi:hypothetical protein
MSRIMIVILTDHCHKPIDLRKHDISETGSVYTLTFPNLHT